MKLVPIARNFLPKDFKITTAQNLQPYLDKLLNFNIESKVDLFTFFNHLSEFEAVVGEEACWRQIHITTDTENKIYQEEFNCFVSTIQPQLQLFANDINKKIIASKFIDQLDDRFEVTLRNIKTSIDLFDKLNVPINSELSLLAQQYGDITSRMTVNVDNKEMTLQQASLFLKEKNADKRKEVYFKIQDRRLQDKEALTKLFETLINKRNLLSQNKHLKNYVEYKFKELNRHDYGVEECYHFHEGIKKYFMPLVDEFYKLKKKQLGVSILKPWDLDAPAPNQESLKPFSTGAELKIKTIECLNKVDPFFSDCIKEMDILKRLDLESRKGKAPGGYNCPLFETGVPFIFMNAVGTLDDVITIIHEVGHAAHSFLSHSLPFTNFKEYPMEIAELASMSMEMFSLDYWDTFFDNSNDLKRAKLQQWERVVTIFPWIAIIDKFQHYVYSNPNNSMEEHIKNWTTIYKEFSSSEIDYTDVEKYIPYHWQKQLHLYEVPFYYIEYGIAQLGALSMYKKYKTDKDLCIKNYKNALSLGGTKPLKKLYEQADINLKFDEDYIQEICTFIKTEIRKLN